MITFENLSDRARPIKVVPYLEWVLNHPEADRGHTQYNRLFAELEYFRTPWRAARGPGQAREDLCEASSLRIALRKGS